MKVLEVHKNKVLQSKDYDIFNYSKKKLSKPRLQALYEDMSEKNLSKDLPIIIDDQFNILDGKYRFEVNKKLDQPIFYKVAEVGNFIDFMKAANLQYKPTLKDYAICHSDKSSYRKCIDYYNKLPLSFDQFMREFFLLHNRMKKDVKKFRDGEFEMTTQDEFKLKQAVKIAEYIHTDVSENAKIGSFSTILEDCDYIAANMVSLCEENKDIITMFNFIIDEGYPLSAITKYDRISDLIFDMRLAKDDDECLTEDFLKIVEGGTVYFKGDPFPSHRDDEYKYEMSKVIIETHAKLTGT